MKNKVFYRVLITASTVLVFGLGGCGFKSDLFTPESEPESSLFEPDNPPAVETEEFLSTSAESAADSASDGVPVDITAIASDARILVSPEESDTEGVPVDIEDLERELNSQ